jgi:hypothetical protein
MMNGGLMQASETPRKIYHVVMQKDRCAAGDARGVNGSKVQSGAWLLAPPRKLGTKRAMGRLQKRLGVDNLEEG